MQASAWGVKKGVVDQFEVYITSDLINIMCKPIDALRSVLSGRDAWSSVGCFHAWGDSVAGSSSRSGRNG